MGWTHNEHQVAALNYADDLILLANTPVGLQDLITGAARGFERGDWSSTRESRLHFLVLRRFDTQHGRLHLSSSLLVRSVCRCWGSNRQTDTWV